MKSLLKVILAVVVLAAAGAVAGVLWLDRALSAVNPVLQPETMFKVAPGTPFRAITAALLQQGLVRDDLALQIYAKYKGFDRSLQAGFYKLSPAMDARVIIEKIATGDRAHFKVTIPEGRNYRKIAPLLAPFDPAAPQAYLKLAEAPTPALRGRHAFLPAAGTLEGYLFPDTYELLEDFGPGLVAAQLARFEQAILPLWQRRPAGWKMSLHETLALASIVELEAVRPEERPVIAGVFLKRLKINMALGADPTVEYALQRHQGKEGLSFKDVAVASPYNTYKHVGLPPGPIGNPGSASFDAVLHPKDTPYLYFVARGDGGHIFTRSGAEHLAAIRQLQALAKP